MTYYTSRDPSKAATMTITKGILGIEDAMHTYGFNGDKWHPETLKSVEEIARKAFNEAGMSERFEGVAHHAKLQMKAGEKGLPLENGVLLALNFEHFAQTAGNNGFKSFDAGASYKSAIQTMVEHADDPITSEYFQQGNIFEKVPRL